MQKYQQQSTGPCLLCVVMWFLYYVAIKAVVVVSLPEWLSSMEGVEGVKERDESCRCVMMLLGEDSGGV